MEHAHTSAENEKSPFIVERADIFIAQLNTLLKTPRSLDVLTPLALDDILGKQMNLIKANEAFDDQVKKRAVQGVDAVLSYLSGDDVFRLSSDDVDLALFKKRHTVLAEPMVIDDAYEQVLTDMAGYINSGRIKPQARKKEVAVSSARLAKLQLVDREMAREAKMSEFQYYAATPEWRDYVPAAEDDVIQKSLLTLVEQDRMSSISALKALVLLGAARVEDDQKGEAYRRDARRYLKAKLFNTPSHSDDFVLLGLLIGVDVGTGREIPAASGAKLLNHYFARYVSHTSERVSPELVAKVYGEVRERLVRAITELHR